MPSDILDGDVMNAEASLSTSTAAWDSELIFVRLNWGARAESAESIARRLRETLALLADLVPGRPDPLSYPTDLLDQQACTAFVRGNVARDDGGAVESASGYRPAVWVPASDDCIAIGIEPSVGNSIPAEALHANSVMVRFGGARGVNPRLPVSSNVRPVAIDVVQGLVSAWQPDFAVLTSRSGNRAQLKLGPPRTPTIGAVTWLSGHYSVPELVTGVEVERYGDGRLLVVGTRQDPSVDTEAVLAVRAELDRAGVLVPAPIAQPTPPTVPALDLLPPDAASAPAPEPPPVDPEAILQRVRGLQVPVPAPLADLADQSGWSEVIADIRQGFDRLVEWEPFINQLGELEQRSSEPVFENLCADLYREVDQPLSSATSGRYQQLARGLAAIGLLDLSDELDPANPFTAAAEAGPELAALQHRVGAVIIDLVRHEVEGRFPHPA